MSGKFDPIDNTSQLFSTSVISDVHALANERQGDVGAREAFCDFVPIIGKKRDRVCLVLATEATAKFD